MLKTQSQRSGISIRGSIDCLIIPSTTWLFFWLVLGLVSVLTVCPAHSQTFGEKTELWPIATVLECDSLGKALSLYEQLNHELPPPNSLRSNRSYDWYLYGTGGYSHTSNPAIEVGMGAVMEEQAELALATNRVSGALTLEVVDPSDTLILAPRFSVWTNYPLIFVGGGIGAGYYTDFDRGGWLVQPEIGADLILARLSWRFDIPVGANSPWKYASGINFKLMVPIAEL